MHAYLGYMSTREDEERLELLQGTLDLLILRTLIFGPQHGQGIARAIQQASEQELLVEHGRFIRRSSAWRPEGGSSRSGEPRTTTVRPVSTP